MKNTIQEDMKNALRERDEIKTGALRMLLSSIGNREKEKRYNISRANAELSPEQLDEKAALSEEEIQEIVASEVKKRRESIEAFQKGGRTEMAEKEEKERKILLAYLPEQFSEEKIRELAKRAIESVGALSVKDMGKVMGQLAPQVKGKADGGKVSSIVREMLSSS